MIIEAAIYAPTGNNHQPWHFTIIQNKEMIDYLNVEAKKIMANYNRKICPIIGFQSMK